MTCKPFYDYLTYGDTCYLTAYTVNGKSCSGKNDLCVITTKERYSDSSVKVVTNSVPFNQCTTEHQNGRHNTRKANTKLVEYDAAKEKQQQEYIEVTVCSREEAIFVTRPTQTESAVSFGGCKEGFER